MTEKTNCIGPAIRDAEGLLFGRRFWWTRNSISWKRLTYGRADLRVIGHKAAGWVSLEAEESYKGEKTITARKVFLTLDRAQAEGLRDFLNTVLGGSAREERTMIGYPYNGYAMEEHAAVESKDGP